MGCKNSPERRKMFFCFLSWNSVYPSSFFFIPIFSATNKLHRSSYSVRLRVHFARSEQFFLSHSPPTVSPFLCVYSPERRKLFFCFLSWNSVYPSSFFFIPIFSATNKLHRSSYSVKSPCLLKNTKIYVIIFATRNTKQRC